jgi:hypothetical protein
MVMEACKNAPKIAMVTLTYPARGGRLAKVDIPWEQGKTLRDYVRSPVLRGKLDIHRVIHSRNTRTNGKKVKLNEVLKPGDYIRISE